MAPAENGAALDILDELRGKFSIIQAVGLFWGFLSLPEKWKNGVCRLTRGGKFSRKGGWRLIQTSGVFQKISAPEISQE